MRGPEQGWLGLIAAIVWNTPKLSEASCKGKSGLFDGDQPHQVRRARSICFACPCLDACREWSAGERLSGVVATKHYRTKRYDERDDGSPTDTRGMGNA
jgi:hypothetical protein